MEHVLQRLTGLEEQNWVHTMKSDKRFAKIHSKPRSQILFSRNLSLFTFIVLAACGLLKARNLRSARSQTGMRAFVSRYLMTKHLKKNKFSRVALLLTSGVMRQNIFGAQSLRESVASEGGGGRYERGCPPSHGRELFNFST